MKGKTLGVQVSTTHATFLANQAFKDVATIKEYKTTDDRDLDLKSGRIDAVLDDQTAIAGAMLAKPDASRFRDSGRMLTGGDVRRRRRHGHLRKSDADLTAKFDGALKAAFADGSIKKYVDEVVQDRHHALIA